MQKLGREERLRRYWDKHARSYDKQMGGPAGRRSGVELRDRWWDDGQHHD